MFYQDIDRYEAEQEEPEAYNDDVETYRDDGTSYYSRSTPSRTDDEKTQIELYKYFLSRGMRQQQALASTRQVMSSMGAGQSKQAELSLGDTGARLLSGAISGGLGATALGAGGSTRKKLIGGGLGALAGLMLNEKERTPAALGATIGGSLYSGGGLRRAATGALLGGTAGAVFPHSTVGAGAIAGAGAGLMHVSATAPMSKFLDKSKLYSLQDRLSNSLRRSPLEARSNQRSALVGGPNAVFGDVGEAVQEIESGLADHAARRMSGASIADSATMKPSWWQRYMPDWMGGLGGGVDLSSGQPGRNLANMDQDEVDILTRARDVLQNVDETYLTNNLKPLEKYSPSSIIPGSSQPIADVADAASKLRTEVAALRPRYGNIGTGNPFPGATATDNFSGKSRNIMQGAEDLARQYSSDLADIRDKAEPGIAEATRKAQELTEQADFLDEVRTLQGNIDLDLVKERIEGLRRQAKKLDPMFTNNDPTAAKLRRQIANITGVAEMGVDPMDFSELDSYIGFTPLQPTGNSRMDEILLRLRKALDFRSPDAPIERVIPNYLDSIKTDDLRAAAARITGPDGQLDELNRLQRASIAALNRRGNVSLRKLQEQAGLLPDLAQRTYDGYLQQAQALRNYRSGFADEAINAAINADNAQAHLMTPLALAGIGAGGGLVLGDRLGMNKEGSLGSVMDSTRSAIGLGLTGAVGLAEYGAKSLFNAAHNAADSYYESEGFAPTPSLPSNFRLAQAERAITGTDNMASLREHINENYPLYLTAAAAALPAAAYFMHNPGMEDMRTRGRI